MTNNELAKRAIAAFNDWKAKSIAYNRDCNTRFGVPRSETKRAKFSRDEAAAFKKAMRLLNTLFVKSK